MPHVNMETDLTNISTHGGGDGESESYLGSGGYGEVRKMVWSKGGGLVVAVKRHQWHLSDKALEELRQEAEAMYDMRHPNVVQLFGASLDRPHTCLAGRSSFTPHG